MEYRVIKENDLFLMTDKSGDIPAGHDAGYGLYARDTRFLSGFELRINGQKPVLLSSSAGDNYIADIRLTNPHMESEGSLILWRESVELLRRRFIYDGALYETVIMTNYFPKTVAFELSLRIASDFADMFVVRGYHGGELGEHLPDIVGKRSMTKRYRGSDGSLRETFVQWDAEDAETVIAGDGTLRFTVELQPKEEKPVFFFIAPVIDGNMPHKHITAEAMAALRAAYDSWNGEAPAVQSDLPSFDRLYKRGLQDMRVLLTDLGLGKFPVAGVPWFAVPFGRDSLIAALQMLPAQSEVAKGTLLTMAAYQGAKIEEWRDEEPGKIMHEMRYGELANTNRIPFTPYFGTIDATPLFLLLAAEYYHWTRDEELIRSLLPNIRRALEWADTYGDSDGDLFIEYFRKSSKGLGNQGWKDSGDSIVHADGEYAKAPIALAEVQGYIYQAKMRLAPILRSLGLAEQADRLEEQAANLREKFEAEFWMEHEQFYAIALDFEKKQVQSVTSNPGHVLMSGLMRPERAKAVAARLVADDMFSGYGIRTMSKRAAGYNPMSYHDGSVWPHDNSLILLGLARLGFREEAKLVLNGLMRAAGSFEYDRLPELFCGYPDSEGLPVPYPVACSPQAWAAGTQISFLQAVLGIEPNGLTRTIGINPVLPDGMNTLLVSGIPIGGGKLSLLLVRDRETEEIAVKMIANTTGYELKMHADAKSVSIR